MNANAATLKNIALAEKERIVSLPMRVGLWMQRQGNEAGFAVDDLDGITLVDRLRDTARSHRSPFVREIFEQTVELQNRWLSWSMDLTRVPDECMDLCVLLKKILTAQEHAAYRMAVFAIAETLALPPAIRTRARKRSFLDTISERVQDIAVQLGMDERRFSKIQPEKRDALSQIGRALQIRADGTSY